MTATVVIGEIPLPSGETALVDAADLPLVQQYRWFALHCPHTTYVRGYRIGDAGRTSRTWVTLHGLLLPTEPPLEPDHRNRNGLDNRRANLRPATRSQNNGNSSHRVGKAGYRGVTPFRGRWVAAIWRDNRRRHLGMFDTPWQAAQAWNEAALEQWGPFALLNERIEP